MFGHVRRRKCHVLSCGAVSAGLSARSSCRAAARVSAAGVGFGHAISFGARGGTECPCFARVSRVRACGRGRVSAPARFAHLIARARRRTHLACPFPPGSFSRPQPVAFCRNAERRPRKPPLSTFILHHTAKCQARPGTKNENSGDFSWNAGGTGGRGDGRAVSFMSRNPSGRPASDAIAGRRPSSPARCGRRPAPSGRAACRRASR